MYLVMGTTAHAGFERKFMQLHKSLSALDQRLASRTAGALGVATKRPLSSFLEYAEIHGALRLVSIEMRKSVQDSLTSWLQHQFDARTDDAFELFNRFEVVVSEHIKRTVYES